VRRQPHDHLPVQLLPGPVIAQRRERLPAFRAAVPAPGKIPEHLEPGQVRVIPPPCPCPRAALPPRAGPGTLPAGGIAGTARRLRARPLRRPPEHHPLQNRQVSAELPQLGSLLRVLRPQPFVLLAQLRRQPRQLPVRIQRRSQHIPQRCLSILRIRDNARRNRHAAQQTSSPAANHAPRASVSQPTALADANTPSHEFRILTRGQKAPLPAQSC